MKIIFPHKISSEILDVIYESKEHLVIVSPYVDFWTRISNDLKAAIKRGVKIDFYTRFDSNNVTSWEQIENIGIKARLIPNLHAKLYFNEKSGVISSMNLLSSSNNGSIEIGCKVNLPEEIEELKSFVETFIIPHETQEKPKEEDIYLSKATFSEALGNFTQTRVYFKNGQFNIQSRKDNYFLTIDKVHNRLNFTAILSGIQAENFNTEFAKFHKSNYFNCELVLGQGNNYDLVIGTSNERLSNSYLDKLLVREKKIVIGEIAELINSVSRFKSTFK